MQHVCILWEIWGMFSITNVKYFLHILLSLYRYPIQYLFPLPCLASCADLAWNLIWLGRSQCPSWLVVVAGRGRWGSKTRVSCWAERSLASLDELSLPPYLQLSSSLCERVRWSIQVTLSDNKEHFVEYLLLKVWFSDQQPRCHLGGCLLEMQNLGTHPRPTESESAFSKITKGLYALHLEKHCFSLCQTLSHNLSNLNTSQHPHFLGSPLFWNSRVTAEETEAGQVKATSPRRSSAARFSDSATASEGHTLFISPSPHASSFQKENTQEELISEPNNSGLVVKLSFRGFSGMKIVLIAVQPQSCFIATLS